MAPLGQALRQRADSQCRHCRGKLRFASPTTVTFAADFGFSLTAPIRVLEKEPRPTAQAISQVLHPIHRSLSTQIRFMAATPFLSFGAFTLQDNDASPHKFFHHGRADFFSRSSLPLPVHGIFRFPAIFVRRPSAVTVADSSASPLPAISKAVPCAGVTTG